MRNSNANRQSGSQSQDSKTHFEEIKMNKSLAAKPIETSKELERFFGDPPLIGNERLEDYLAFYSRIERAAKPADDIAGSSSGIWLIYGGRSAVSARSRPKSLSKSKGRSRPRPLSGPWDVGRRRECQCRVMRTMSPACSGERVLSP